MRRLQLLTLAIPLLASLSCNDVTAPTSAVRSGPDLRAPLLTLVTPSTTPQVYGGYYHTCALKADGTVVCWGHTEYGQATVPAGLASVAQLSPGGFHNCALKTDGTVFCWGFDAYGQATVPDGLNSVVQVSGGYSHSCALKTDGTVICWGDNSQGQAAVPEGLVSVIEVSAGYLHTCALKADKTVVCWGSNGLGQATVPDGLASVAQVSAGTYHTCALKTDLTVVCWGYDGDGLTVPDGLVSVGQVSAGGAHTCALRTDGTVFCWGQNGFGQATVPDGLAEVAQLSADAAHSCALKIDGTVACWGDDQFGQVTVPDGLNLLGTPQSITFTSSAPAPGLVGGSYSVSATGGASGNPVVLASLTESVCTMSGSNVTLLAAGTCAISASQAGGSGYQAAHDVTQSFLVITPLAIPTPSAQVSAGGYHTCASSVTGQMTCWGNNDYGQANVPSGAALVSLGAAGYFHTCSLATDGIVHCGYGDGTLQPMPALSQVAQIDAGEQYVMCALQTNRTVVCWGNNGGGNATVPAGLVNVAEVAVGHNHACARKADGSVVCWGLNNEGETTVPSGLANVTQLSAGGFHTCALKADATLACWGNNYFGESTVPSGLGGVAQVSVGYQHTCAVKSDGALVCWGNSDNGRTAIPVNLPAVSKVSAGRYHTCAMTTAGNVVCWGDNGFGQTTVPVGLNLLGLQSINFTSSAPVPALVGGSYSVSATGGGSGNPVVFTSLTGSVCSVSGSNVALLASGTCTISASQAGGSGYQAATDTTQSFLVTTPLAVPVPSAQISAGGYHTCASSVTGQMTCWGNNDYGQANVPSGAASVSQAAAGYFHTCSLATDGVVHCGNGDGTLQPMAALSQVAQIDAGEQYVMCALQTNRTVVCWGNNGGGNATVPSGLVNVAEVAVGHNHACAIKVDGSVVCWGQNTAGQATPPSGLANVTQLSAGGSHSCALKADGAVSCWGNNPYGQTNVPSGIGTVVQVSAGYEHTCAVKSNATLACWGNSGNGRTTIPANLPPVSKVSAGRYHTCVITTAGSVLCWGDNGFGQTNVPTGLNVLGLQSISFTSVAPSSGVVSSSYAVTANGGASGSPVIFSSLTPSNCSVTGSSVTLSSAGTCTIAANQAAANGYSAATQVTQSFTVVALLSTNPSVGAGTFHSCALRPTGTVSCWGNNDENRSTPPAGLGTVAQLSVGNLYNCALLATRTVSCWGRNEYGSTDVPAGLSDVVQLSAGGLLTCVLKSSASVQCWGADTDGQLNPPAGLNALQVAAGGDAYGCALKTDATVVCWGFGGDGRTTVPVGLANVQQISTGYVHTCAVRNDGTVACWGPNPDDRATVPVGLSNAVQVSAGGAHTCAVKSDGTVACWGVNTSGQASPPFGLSGVQQVSGGATHTCARKTDGTIVCWGSSGLINVPADLRPASQAQTITFTSTPPSPALIAGSYNVSATGGASGNGVVFTSLTQAVCTVSGSAVTLSSEGTCTIAANQSGSVGYDAAPQNMQSFAVTTGAQAIVFTSTPSSPVYGASYAVSATGGASGNPVTFTSLTTGVCTVVGDAVGFGGGGSCTIAADQAGNASYAAAPQATQTFTVAKAAQVITFTTQPPSPAILGNSYDPAGTSSSSLPVTFTTAGSCSFTAGSVQFGSVGSCTVTAHATGNGNYLDAEGPTQAFPVIYNFTGFLPTVSNAPVVNTDKTGAIIKLKFTLGGDKGLNVLAAGSPISGDISGNCSTTGSPATTMPALAGAGFKYDPTTGQYIYAWQTDTRWVGTCRQFILTLADGTVHRANFQFAGTATPFVVLTVTPTQVTAGAPTTMRFTVDATSPSALQAAGGGLPCTLQPSLAAGATDYTGSCSFTTTFATPSGTATSYAANYATSIVVLDQVTQTSATIASNVVAVTVVAAPSPVSTLTVSPSQATAGVPTPVTLNLSVTSQTPITNINTPCPSAWQPAVPVGATSYTGTCSWTNIFAPPPPGSNSSGYLYAAYVSVAGRSGGTYSNNAGVIVTAAGPPIVTLSISPTQVTAGVASTITFTVSVSSPTNITSISGLPCSLPAPGPPNYVGSCSFRTTFNSPGPISYAAVVATLGRSAPTSSPVAQLTVLKRNQ